jgi:hypothetical protein
MAFFQVLPKETGMAERFGEGFGQAFGGTLQDQIGQFFQEKKESKELERLQEQLKPLSPDATLGERLQAIMMARASPKTKEKFMELMKLQGATDFAKKFKEGKDVSEADLIEGMALGYIDPGYAQAKIRQLGEIPKRDQTKKIAEVYGIPPDLISSLDPAAAHKFAEANRKENLDVYKEITDLTSSATKKLDDLARLRNFIRRGALDPVSAGNFAAQMEKANRPILASIGRALESGDAAAAQSLIKNFFAENIKGLPAKGVNIFVEGIMRDALPLMGRSKEANLAVADVIEEGLKAAFIPSQVRQEILSEHGGSIPWNFNALYQQRLAQRVDEQLNKAIAKGREVIEKYDDEEEIKIPSGNRINVYDKKTGRLLGDIDEEEVEKVDTNLYIVR